MTGWYARNGIDPDRWAATRRAAFKRDGWRCRQCGRPGRLECHHIRALADGGARYALDNVETLCRGCHVAFHRSERRKPEPEAVTAWRAFRDELRKENAA